MRVFLHSEEWFCPHESKLPLVRSSWGRNENLCRGVGFNQITVTCTNTRYDYQLQDAGFLLFCLSSDAFSISRRAFLVDTTISCSALVQKSWIPQAVDNKKEDAIQDVFMLFGDSNSREARCLMLSSRQLIHRNSTELERCIACIFDQPM